MTKTILGALSLCLLTGAAQAQNLATLGSASFGAPGQVSIGSDFNLSFLHHSGVTELSLQPAAVYFIAPQLAVGGDVLLSYNGTDEDSFTHVGFGPRVGYNIPLGALLSFFPQGGLRYDHAIHSATSQGVTRHSSANYLTLLIYAPFLFHPVSHFFIGLGPVLTVDLVGGNADSRETTVGLQSTVGGWFDW
jgi:hypothetical protein